MARAAAPALDLTAHQHSELMQLTRLPSTPQSIVLRAKIVLGAAEGIANKALAVRLATTRMTVLLWRNRYAAEGLAGILEDRPRSGRPKEISPEQEAEIVEATRSTKPKNATHGFGPVPQRGFTRRLSVFWRDKASCNVGLA